MMLLCRFLVPFQNTNSLERDERLILQSKRKKNKPSKEVNDKDLSSAFSILSVKSSSRNENELAVR